ncbi:MotA/TolQ/ExbB proton channel family protein [Aliiglaciecola lipolytica]|uniref:Transporter, MotA/TolQ/ExbB proton channel family n=1 Tax=Aliiglaciecola lipolytica E3 TaxID=1127673 RepID=K6Y7U6_9ALTE|nr:MotA/TolQ/ExbB proton channel family protein [Aliiglaciecola lipolytica]GAC12738.1 transporter, MotA/TolQ/ExbB proton channel family [Aliiglaciecola lipolytica E3]
MNPTQQVLANPIIWMILGLALVSYSVLLHLIFSRNSSEESQMKTTGWLQTLPAMLSALPLLGLLGTIIGLLQTFGQMAAGGIDVQQLLSSSIADAMLTTEVGLLMVIPGWVMLSALQRKQQNMQLRIQAQHSQQLEPQFTELQGAQ